MLCEGNNASKRLLRLALAEQMGPLEMARELRKRLASIARAGSLLDDLQRDELLRELERQRQAISGPIAAHDSALAVDLLWEGLAHLRLRLEALRQRSSGSTTATTEPDWVVRLAMLDIADVLGDAEAYLAEYRDHSPEALTVPAIAAKVATRLTKGGRAEEALTLLQAADPTLRRRRTGAEEWCDAPLDALDALGRSDEAQAQRWEFALLEISARHLRDYLKRLPAFADMPDEEKALDLVADHDDLEEALWFLLHWPEPHRAARLVLAAPKPLNGDRYILLVSLAELLEQRQPLAATVCLRTMVDFTLKLARSKRCSHAARQLETCHRLAAAINDWGELVDHGSSMAQLRRDHGRKYGFWGEVPKKIIPEAEAGVKAVDKGVGDKGGESRELRGPGARAAEASSVQPGLW